MKYTCPCCRYKTLDEEPPDTFDICEICFWEDDGVQFDALDYEGGERIMNQASKMYWNKYWKHQKSPKSVSEWKFGGDSEYLAQLVVDGIKTATCSGHIFYELKNEPLPTTGDYGIVLDSKDKPLAIIKTTEVTLTPMNEVTEEFAIAEGDGSYQKWWDIHEEYFKDELNAVGLEFSEDILLVCERFEVIDIKNG